MIKSLFLGVILCTTMFSEQTYDKIAIRYKNINSVPIIYKGKPDLEKLADIEMTITDYSLVKTVSEKIFTVKNMLSVENITMADIDKNAFAIIQFYSKDKVEKRIIINANLNFYIEGEDKVKKLNSKARQVFQDNFPFMLFFK